MIRWPPVMPSENFLHELKVCTLAHYVTIGKNHLSSSTELVNWETNSAAGKHKITARIQWHFSLYFYCYA